ncbi:tRNA pseudouridine(38-40) synthase TruA [Nocardioides terrae]|uniref:tRNA pseudouridine(38-40) synthase TruA n=1 Tax=Nocardioides terrae TaxID=574651 RepID=UPI001C31C988|nr:tRNA pseudouridine(38-40) synthase TruA [Nocardioides terrae]
MRIRIDLAYDGTDFHGWATQPGLRTVQGELQAALTTAFRLSEPLRVTCAGRTDTGVHARGQVVHVDVDDAVVATGTGRSAQPPLDALVRRLNGMLPADVRVHRASEAAPGFDARFSALWRRYAYRIADAPAAYDPLRRHHVLHWPRPLDLSLMNVAAVDLIGLHDFAGFCKAREGATTIRTIQTLVWERDETGVAVARVVADAFCHGMVRALVGCLLAIGEGRKEIGWAREVLGHPIRTSAVHAASPRGLTLEEVGYPADAELEARAEQTRAKREAIDE